MARAVPPLALTLQLEAALMEIKRAHLLQQLDSLEQQQAQPSTSSRLAEGESCRWVRPHALAMAFAPLAERRLAGVSLPLHRLCSFRYTDGCYYAGIVGPRQHSSDADAYSVYFAVPTRQFMLHPVVVPAALVQASAPAAPGAQDLTVGRRLLARQRHWRFFEPAEGAWAAAAAWPGCKGFAVAAVPRLAAQVAALQC